MAVSSSQSVCCRGIENLLEASKAAGVKKFVRLSGLSVGVSPKTFVGAMCEVSVLVLNTNCDGPDGIQALMLLSSPSVGVQCTRYAGGVCKILSSLCCV